MRHTSGPWAWRVLGGRLMLVADYARRRVVLASARSGEIRTCDPTQDAAYLLVAKGDEPDLRLIAAAPDVARDLARLLYAPYGDAWESARRSLASALGADLDGLQDAALALLDPETTAKETPQNV